MRSLREPRFDIEMMRAVAAAYERERQAGRAENTARNAAEKAFRARNSAFAPLPASAAASRIIIWIAREHMARFWKGVCLREHR